MDKNSIFYSLYYGAVTPWEERTLAINKDYKKQALHTCNIQEKLLATLNEEEKELLETFLKENAKLTSYFEEEKFKEGFVLGTRLMIETFTDNRYDDKGA